MAIKTTKPTAFKWRRVSGKGVFSPSGLKNVYGADRPSPIPNPTRGGRGEPIPKPGLPPEYPSYLRPIPVNTRDIEKVFREHLRANEPGLMRILYSTWNADRQAIKYQEIRNAIRDRQFSPGFLEGFEQTYTTMIAEELRPRWEAAIARSAQFQGNAIRSKFGSFPRFDMASARMVEWFNARGVELAVQLSTSQTTALRSMLQFYTVEQPVSAAEMGRLIRATVGLTPKQAKAVAAFRESLVAGGELTASQVTHQTQNYAGRLHRIRAERIARTELSFAFNYGQLEQMRQAGETVLSGETIVKRWLTGDDERVCDHCGPLDGQIVGIESTFPGATKLLPNILTTPAHPGCRCTIIYSVLRE